MTRERLGLGRLGEDLAARELARRGYVVVERNARTAAGEIDLVVRDGATWAFVEVRCRRGQGFGRPEESVTARKRAHLLGAAEAYAANHDLGDAPWRIDFVAVELAPDGRLLRVELTRNAVTA